MSTVGVIDRSSNIPELNKTGLLSWSSLLVFMDLKQNEKQKNTQNKF